MALLVLAGENAENGRVLGRETRAACVTKMQEVGENITMNGNSRFPDYPYFCFCPYFMGISPYTYAYTCTISPLASSI